MKKTPRVSQNPSPVRYMMDLLARRNHSEKELREKGQRKGYTDEEIEEAISICRESNWMLPPEELSELVVAELNRKRKGYRFIRSYLDQKGLPQVDIDLETELEKCLDLANRLMDKKPLKKATLVSRLSSRGFLDETIRTVVFDKGVGL